MEFKGLTEKEELLAKFLRSYSVYYNVKREDAEEPFAAEAIFKTNDEQYFLVKAAKLGEMRSAEYAYFATMDELNAESLQALDNTAWERGVAKVEPSINHKSTDVTLIILADSVTDEAKTFAKRAKHTKSYRHSLWGFSNYRLVVVEISSNTAYYNRQGRILRKLVTQILN